MKLSNALKKGTGSRSAEKNAGNLMPRERDCLRLHRHLRTLIRQLPVAAFLILLTSGVWAADKPSVDLKSYDPPAKALLSRMSLDEKIGQMTQAELTYLGDLTDIAKYSVGSVLSGGDADPKDGNSPEAWTAAVERCQEQAHKTRLAIPLLYGIDAVHGHNNVLGATIFPHDIGLGCANDPALVEEIGRITAEEMRATGVNWAFAPCVTVPQDIRWGRTYEGYSENPDISGKLGAAAVRGLQGQSLHDPFSVLACAKHYAGDGGTTFGTGGMEKKGLDQGDVRVDDATMRRLHLKPYPPAIAAGVGSIMPSYNSWNGLKCSANKYLLTDVLKGEFGFDGFLISDYNAIDQVAPDYKEAVGICINAGIDMGMVPNAHAKFIKCLRELVEEGKVPVSRIDDAVTRILRVKSAMGLIGKGAPIAANAKAQESFGSDEHRAVAREAVRKSLVLLKNEHKTLPLAKDLKHIHVAGPNADDMGKQCGGWTITWQGAAGNVVKGTTILAGIRAAVGKDTKVTYSADGAGGEGADVVILVVGESPYAEMHGDSRDLALTAENSKAAETVKALKVPTVLVVVSGRPVLINNLIEQADACVAAWLPGSEGQGVADVLFGDYRPTGHLAFTWPKSLEQLPLRNDKNSGKPLYEFGCGLTYGE